jgi:CheY-like chemotaxis protein
MRVLVVEDEVLVREDLAQALRVAGHDVDAVGNGRAALACMRRRIPDVVVLDLRMPLMNGIEFRAEQLRDDRLAPVPVIVVSGNADDEMARSLGAFARLGKPTRISDLLRTIERLAETQG